ncbi:MAG: F0F1 ATP synthase subunit gamma [Campylobacteraceae bacterium 4484_4]|nr:MAG: F0F1 ATP synthase subunit gamma [Campylobacteraceae bacterium 4484_4]
MANLKDIKRNITSVKNTQKTTRAMKLVSTAKLRRAEEAAKRARVYADKLNEMLSEISEKINHFKVGGSTSKFFDIVENPKVVDILFITADKGLCGGFNIQTIKRVRALMDEYKAKGAKIRLRAVGRKGIDFFNFQGTEMLEKEVGVSSAPTYEKAQEVIGKAVADFVDGQTDKVILVHNGYKNMITQEIKQVNLMPVDTLEVEAATSESMLEVEAENEEEVLDSLIKKYIEYNMFFALIDSLAAEHSARMQAMDNATNNAKERVQQLTIQYNKARQEAITTELIEIISGMESLK